MIVDLILDRYDGKAYDPHDFYFDVLQYRTSCPMFSDHITMAMDYGTETDVKNALCDYIGNEYNPKIKDFINNAKWLSADNGKDWENIVPII